MVQAQQAQNDVLVANQVSSLYGGDNIRYHWQLKNNYVSQFKKVLNEELPDMKIRYIF
jgi:hypothetical protein